MEIAATEGLVFWQENDFRHATKSSSEQLARLNEESETSCMLRQAPQQTSVVHSALSTELL